MIPITDNEAAVQAKYDIELALLKGERWQLLVNDEAAITLEKSGHEFSVEWGKLIFAWWTDERSQSWRVTAYEIAEAEISLRVSRGLMKETVSVTLRDAERWQAKVSSQALAPLERRSGYGSLLARLIVAHFDDAQVQRINTSGDRVRSLPVHYARLIVKRRNETILIIGANDGETQAEIDSILAAGLIWLADFQDKREDRNRAKQLWLCVPRGRSQTTLERLTMIETTHLGATVECFEVDEVAESLVAVRAMTQAELLNEHPRELRWPEADNQQNPWRERIVSLAPDLIEVSYHAGQDAESYSIHGLEFARVNQISTTPRAKFGVAIETRRHHSTAHQSLPPARTLTESNFSELTALVGEIVAQRSANAADQQHPLYQLRAEAWLESLLRRDITQLDPRLDPRFVYSQIPTWRADERSVIDLLAVTDEGRLAVIEIKAAEDLNLPLQGIDYWLRVEQARARGDFARRGLFAGIRLTNQSPLLYLVAPRLRFHRTFATMARCLAPEIEAYQIGLNTNWRERIRVHTKDRVNVR